MTDTEQEVIRVPDRRAANPYRKPFMLVVFAVCLSLLSDSISSWLTFDVAQDTNKIVSDVDFRNSAENQAQQQKALEEIILRVDCNARKAIEEAMNDIAAENPSFSFEVNITTERCGDTETADPEE